MGKWLMVVGLMLAACGGEAGEDGEGSEPGDMSESADSEPEIPTCPGDEPPAVGECKRYMLALGCYRWDECERDH